MLYSPVILKKSDPINLNRVRLLCRARFNNNRARLVLGSDLKHIGLDYNWGPICYRVRLNEIGSDLIFESD